MITAVEYTVAVVATAHAYVTVDIHVRLDTSPVTTVVAVDTSPVVAVADTSPVATVMVVVERKTNHSTTIKRVR